MPQMCATVDAQDLSSYHALAYVQLFFHTSSICWRREARPSGARIKFRVRGKYDVAAADAFVDALVLAVVVVFLPENGRFSAPCSSIYFIYCSRVRCFFVNRLVCHTKYLFVHITYFRRYFLLLLPAISFRCSTTIGKNAPTSVTMPIA
jgi:hypothetical protein